MRTGRFLFSSFLNSKAEFNLMHGGLRKKARCVCFFRLNFTLLNSSKIKLYPQ